MPVGKVKKLCFHAAQQCYRTFPKVISVHPVEIFTLFFVGWKLRPETQASSKNTLGTGSRL